MVDHMLRTTILASMSRRLSSEFSTTASQSREVRIGGAAGSGRKAWKIFIPFRVEKSNVAHFLLTIDMTGHISG